MPATNRYYDALNTAARLPARVLRNFSLAAAVAGTGATIAMLLPTPFANAAIAATTTTENVMTLPTVVVRPEVQPVTLATITVRGDARRDKDDRASMLARARETGLHAVSSLAHRGATGSGLAMPYYSFAKPLRVSNEE